MNKSFSQPTAPYGHAERTGDATPPAVPECHEIGASGGERRTSESRRRTWASLRRAPFKQPNYGENVRFRAGALWVHAALRRRSGTTFWRWLFGDLNEKRNTSCPAKSFLMPAGPYRMMVALGIVASVVTHGPRSSISRWPRSLMAALRRGTGYPTIRGMTGPR
jgi:hypothetical protein